MSLPPSEPGDHALTGPLADLLQHVREDEPSTAQLARLQARMSPWLQPPPGAPPEPPPAPPAASPAPSWLAQAAHSVPLKVGAVALVSAASAGLWLAGRSPDAPAVPVVPSAPTAITSSSLSPQPTASSATPEEITAPAVSSSTPSAPATTGSIEQTSGQGARRPLAPVAVSPTPPVASAPAPAASASAAVDPPESEAQLIRRAQQASSPAQRLELATRHQALFPSGSFAQEREMLALQALVELGRRSEAISRGRLFLQAFPRSVHRPRIEALLPELAGADGR